MADSVVQQPGFGSQSFPMNISMKKWSKFRLNTNYIHYLSLCSSQLAKKIHLMLKWRGWRTKVGDELDSCTSILFPKTFPSQQIIFISHQLCTRHATTLYAWLKNLCNCHWTSVRVTKIQIQEHSDIGPSAYFAKLGKKKVNEEKEIKKHRSRLMAATQIMNQWI